MGLRPTPKHSIERQDNNGNYESNNCCWATNSAQMINRRMFKNNTSGYRGVSKTTSGKFRAQINRSGKAYLLGRYNSVVEAAEAYNTVALRF